MTVDPGGTMRPVGRPEAPIEADDEMAPSTPGIVAHYADADAAGRAIEQLSLNGIDAGRISLLGGEDGHEGDGDPGDRRGRRGASDRTARDDVDGDDVRRDAGALDATGRAARQAQRRIDAGTGRRLVRRFGTGLVIGLVAGAAVGAVVVVLATPGGAVAAISGAIMGGAAGAGLGALTGLQSTPTMSTAWASTFAAGDGRVVVGVEAPDEAALDDVEHALAGTGAVEIRRVSDLSAVTDQR